MTDIYLDNNIFDFLYETNIDIVHEFPKELFRLCITKEIKFETEPIQDIAKQQFIQKLIEKDIKIVSFFIFSDPRHPFDKQRGGCWDDDSAVWDDDAEENEQYRAELNKKFLVEIKNTKHDLYKEEADIDLAVRSIKNIVLTFDKKEHKKKGPLNDAYEKGYKVVFLTGFDTSKDTLNLFVKLKLKERGFEIW